MFLNKCPAARSECYPDSRYSNLSSMSKLTNTLDKLKDLKERVKTSRETQEDIKPLDNSSAENVKRSTETHLVENEVSPIKERILTQFARLAPKEKELTGGLASEVEKGPLKIETCEEKNKRGRLDMSLDRFKEQKTARERLKMSGRENSASLDIEPDNESELSARRLSHSYSELSLHEHTARISSEQDRLHSQIFDFDAQEFTLDPKLEPSSGQIGSEGTNTPEIMSPTKSQRRFMISSFLSRKSHLPATDDVIVGSPNKTQEVEPKIGTPKRTLRSLMSSYVRSNKSAPITPEFASGSPTETSLNLIENPSSDTVVLEHVVPVDPTGHREETREVTPVSEVEEGLEAEELLSPVEEEDEPKANVVAPIIVAPSPARTQVPPLLNELFSPLLIALLAVLNFVLPLWIGGFLTGMILSMILTYWVMIYFNPPVTYDVTPPPTSRSRIEVHEPPALVEAWMNLLPHQFHPYSVDNYEVRQTVSVRISVEHHMLKIEYPEWNIPKRLGPEEEIPPDLKFLFHSDHIDLTKAKISLLPEGIAGKRMFSKKYPIEILANALNKSGDKLSKLGCRSTRKHSLDVQDNSDNEDTFHDIDDLDNVSLESMEIQLEPKVFYLFARADREKEDLYKSFIDAHHFLSDTVLDVARREGAITEGIDRDAGGRETVRERKTMFNEFMTLVIDDQKFSTDNHDDNDTHCLRFINIFLNRIFYDIHKSEEIKTLLKKRIYNKLLKIKITQWFKSFDLIEINMGSILPQVSWVRNVHQNERGLWVELGLKYDGIASATIETCGFNLGEEGFKEEAGAVHLRDLMEDGTQGGGKHGGAGLSVHQPGTRPDTVVGRKVSSRIEAATNSDEEDSAEEDSEDSQELPVEQVVGSVATEPGAGHQRWWEVVGNSELVKSGINRLSNSEWWKQKTSKKITLHLEITSLKGVVVLCIPPPPSDRLWYGFKSVPDLGLRIVPYYGENKLGEDNTFFSSAVNKGIGVLVNRLKEEIHKFILLPNMDDIPIHIMDPFPTSNVTEDQDIINKEEEMEN